MHTGGGTGIQCSEELGRWAHRARAGDEPAGGSCWWRAGSWGSVWSAGRRGPWRQACLQFPSAGRRAGGAPRPRFGGDAPWTEIRFSTLPTVGNTKTGSAGGATVTVTRTGPSTFNWQSSNSIDLVWVDAGDPPHASSAAYRYDPPTEATGDSGLSGTDGQDPLDHVLVCFDRTTTTAPDDGTSLDGTRGDHDGADDGARGDDAGHHGHDGHGHGSLGAGRAASDAAGPPAHQGVTTQPPTVLSVPARTPSTARRARPRGRRLGSSRRRRPRGQAAEDRVGDGSVVGSGATLVGLGLVTLALRPPVVAERRRGLISSARGAGPAPARR